MTIATLETDIITHAPESRIDRIVEFAPETIADTHTQVIVERGKQFPVFYQQLIQVYIAFADIDLIVYERIIAPYRKVEPFSDLELKGPVQRQIVFLKSLR